MIRVWSLAISCAIAVTSAAGAQIRRFDQRSFIAFRYDAERVVIYTADDATRKPPDPRQPRGLPPGAQPLPPPVARYPGPHIVELATPPEVTDRPGDRWTIDAAAGVTVTATAERPVFGGGDCFGSYGVIARVDEPWREAFRAVRFKYHVGRRGAGDTRLGRSVLGEASGGIDAGQRARIEVVVRPEIARAVREVTDAAAPTSARATSPSRHWAAAWKRTDATLLSGEGTLDFDVQTYQLTPDGDPRLYVRAQLLVARQSAFVMWFWVRDRGDGLTVEHRNAELARHIRIGEYGGPRFFPLSRAGEVLAVTDIDGNGWAEILVSVHGYEGHAITAYEYTPDGLLPTGASFQWGC